MLNDLLVVGGSVLTLLLMMAVGFVLAKLGRLTRDALSQMSSLLLSIVAPMLMVDAFQDETCDPATVRGLLIAAAVLVGIYVVQGLLIALFYRRQPQHDRGVSRFASVYGNVGFMGIPLIQSVMGSAGMLTAVVSLAVFNIGIWTHGAWLIGGKSQLSVKRVALNPGVIGLAVSLILFFARVQLPGPVASAVSYIGSLNTPLAMVIIGAQMATVKFGELFRDVRLYAVSAVKLLLIPALFMVLLLPLNLDPSIYVAVIILSACPVAGATSLMCQMNGKDSSLAARLVTLTTVISVATLPVVAAIAKMIAGM